MLAQIFKTDRVNFGTQEDKISGDLKKIKGKFRQEKHQPILKGSKPR